MGTWRLTCGLVNVLNRYLTALCFHENCLLVVIISCVGDVTIFLCFCGAIGVSTLFTLGNPCIIGATKMTQHLRGYGHLDFWLRCALQPLINTLSQAYPLVRINLQAFGWLSSFFNAFGWRIISGLIGTLFCGLQYSTGLLCIISWPSLQHW